MANQTWSLDDLTITQRRFLGERLCQTNDGSMFLEPSDPVDAWSLVIARELAKLGLVDIDEPRAGSNLTEIGVSLTDDGEAWIKSLPEGSLAT